MLEHAEAQKVLAGLIHAERRYKEVSAKLAMLINEREVLRHRKNRIADELLKIDQTPRDISHEKMLMEDTANKIKIAEQQNQRYLWYTNQINNLQETLARVDKELSELAPVECVTNDHVQQASQQITDLRVHSQQANEALRQAVSERDSAQALVQITTTKLAEQEDKKRRLEAVTARLDKLLALSGFLRKNREIFMQQLWDNLLGYTNKFISDATGGAMTEFIRDEGSFYYVENGIVFPVACASGMQTAILGVALKLSLGAALGVDSPILLLDEVTAAGSAENSAVFVELLKEQAGQVFLVTHREADAALADWVIRIGDSTC
jgi:DNA repair exonuclease SbcCD ATPase subunit